MKLLQIQNHYKLNLENKFRISPPTWTHEFELSSSSYSIADIQDCFEYITKKYISVIEKHLRLKQRIFWKS